MSTLNCSIAIQSLPQTNSHAEMIAAIDAVIAHIKAFAQTHHYTVCVSPFETVIEGDFDALMQLVKSCQTVAIEAGSPAVMSYIKINYNPNGVMRIDEKIQKHQ